MKLNGLQLYDVDADRGTVMIRQGKGKKDRMVPIGQPSACSGAFGDLESAKIAAYVRQWEEQAVMIRFFRDNMQHFWAHRLRVQRDCALTSSVKSR